MYKLRYGLDGKVAGIGTATDFIPLCEGNSDFQDFLKWNSAQKTPLDLNSTIEVVKPEPARDLVKEMDDLKERLEAVELKAETLEAQSIGVIEK
jgi:hypothetical protein